MSHFISLNNQVSSRKGSAQSLMKDPGLLLTVITVFLIFAAFIIYPFSRLLAMTVNNSTWLKVLTDSYIWLVFRNTIFSSLLSTLVAVSLGFVFAYTMNYVEFRGKRLLRLIALIPNMAPSIVTGLAFIMLFGRRGFITYRLLGLRLNPYGPVGLLIVQSIAFFPLAYITISGVLKSISANLELSAQNLGASGFKLFMTVTLPLASPGVFNAFLLVFINALADFGNPNLIGGNYKTLATEAYSVITGEFDLPRAAVLSILLVIPSLLVFVLQKYALERRSFVTVTGKPSSGLKRNFISRSSKFILCTISSLICALIIMIFATVVLFAITKSFGADNSLTLKHLQEGIFSAHHLQNSWKYSLIAASLVSLLGLVLAFLQVRKKFLFKGLLDFLAMLPVSIPGTFIGLALIIAFNEGALKLTGTGLIIVIAMLIRQLPVGYRNAMAGFKQIDKSIEEAAVNLGANSQKVFTSVILPILRNQVSITLVYCFMKSMNTLSTVIFLVVPATQVSSINILAMADQGFYGPASASALGMVGAILITFGIAKLIFRDKIRIFDL